MLASIPFHISLLKAELGNNKKSTNAHVLVYGAIEIHALGEKGCIASNNRLAAETGYSKSRVEDVLSEMSQAGWIKVVIKNGNRLLIEPNLIIGKMQEGGFLPVGGGVPASRNIYNSLDNNNSVKDAERGDGKDKEEPPKENDNSFTSLLVATEERSDDDTIAPVVENTTFALYHQVVRHYSLPTQNKGHIKKWSNDLDVLLKPEVAQRYLRRLLERDLRLEREQEQFVPQLSTAHSILMQCAKIIQYFSRTYRTTTLSTEKSSSSESDREAEAKLMREKANEGQ